MKPKATQPQSHAQDTSKSAWDTHNPFRRATPEMIRAAQQREKLLKQKRVQDVGDALF